MFDLEQSDEPKLQRARGRADVRFDQIAGRTRLARLHQSGSAKAMLPDLPGAPEVVFLNTAGGLTGGDQFEFRLDVAPGGRVCATTQAAERAYAAAGGVARVQCRFTAGAGAALDWLPQETILYDRAALERDTLVDLAGDARLLMCETLVLGRAAMGETLRDIWLRDRREVRRDGRPVLFDAVLMDGGALAQAAGPAMLGSARAVALVALIAPGAEDALGPVRDLLGGTEVEAAASAWNGRCLVRLMADDAWPLRRQMIRILTQLRGAAPPRVWQI